MASNDEIVPSARVALAEERLERLMHRYPDLTAGDIYYNPETGELRLRDDKGV